MFSQMATRIALVLAGLVSLVIGLKLAVLFLTPTLGPGLMHSQTAAAALLWGYLTPGLTALLALAMLAGLWWLFSGPEAVMGRRRKFSPAGLRDSSKSRAAFSLVQGL